MDCLTCAPLEYEREFEERRTIKKKLKKVYGGSFSLTVDDLKVDRFRYYLLYTKKVYLPLVNSQNKVTTKDFIKKATLSYDFSGDEQKPSMSKH